MIVGVVHCIYVRDFGWYAKNIYPVVCVVCVVCV